MKIIGHRGAKGLAPENSIAGFKKALELGVDQIECDVRVTRDGVPVMAHDPEIKTLAISKHTFDQLRAVQPDLLRLDDMLHFIDGRAPIYLEVKPDQDVEPITRLLKRAKGEILLASFDFKVLVALHHALPDRTVIVLDKWSGVRASWRARQLGTTYISMNQKYLWSGFVHAVARRGWHLYAYTLNDPGRAARWQKHGLYGVITDYPDRFLVK